MDDVGTADDGVRTVLEHVVMGQGWCINVREWGLLCRHAVVCMWGQGVGILLNRGGTLVISDGES